MNNDVTPAYAAIMQSPDAGEARWDACMSFASAMAKLNECLVAMSASAFAEFRQSHAWRNVVLFERGAIQQVI